MAANAFILVAKFICYDHEYAKKGNEAPPSKFDYMLDKSQFTAYGIIQHSSFKSGM